MPELLPVTNYLPDVARLRQNGVTVFIAVGEWGLARNAWYVRAARSLVEQLGSELVTLPGHHSSFLDQPQAWAEVLHNILQRVSI